MTKFSKSPVLVLCLLVSLFTVGCETQRTVTRRPSDRGLEKFMGANLGQRSSFEKKTYNPGGRAFNKKEFYNNKKFRSKEWSGRAREFKTKDFATKNYKTSRSKYEGETSSYSSQKARTKRSPFENKTAPTKSFADGNKRMSQETRDFIPASKSQKRNRRAGEDIIGGPTPGMRPSPAIQRAVMNESDVRTLLNKRG